MERMRKIVVMRVRNTLATMINALNDLTFVMETKIVTVEKMSMMHDAQEADMNKMSFSIFTRGEVALDHVSIGPCKLNYKRFLYF